MARVEGIVKVEFEIAKDGKVSNAVAKSGHPILQNGSVDVVKALQFQSSNCVRHETIEFRYSIRGKEGISRCAQLWINFPVIEVTQTPPELNVNVSY
jgi:TonB-like protein